MDYFRRPVPVQAVLWDGSEGAREAFEKMLGSPTKQVDKGMLLVAGMMVPFGLWVVKMPDGVVRAYPPEDFAAKYATADEMAELKKT